MTTEIQTERGTDEKTEKSSHEEVTTKHKPYPIKIDTPENLEF